MNNQSNRHLKCRICKHIPEKSYVTYCRDEQSGKFPPQVNKLIVVGAPYFKIISSASRYHVLHQCPYCGTFYSHDLDYEYLATGSEDEYSYTRLSDDKGLAWARKNFTIIFEQTSPEEELDWKKAEKKVFNYKFST